MLRGSVGCKIVVCGAGPAADVTKLMAIAQGRGWTTAITATTAARSFLHAGEVEPPIPNGVRTSFQSRNADERVLPSIDALVVAPATFNTINKLALGIADTHPLTSMAELIGRGVPTVIVPFVNSALAGRVPFKRSVSALRNEGAVVLHGSGDGWEPHPPGSGNARRVLFPWRNAFELAVAIRGTSAERGDAGHIGL